MQAHNQSASPMHLVNFKSLKLELKSELTFEILYMIWNSDGPLVKFMPNYSHN